MTESCFCVPPRLFHEHELKHLPRFYIFFSCVSILLFYTSRFMLSISRPSVHCFIFFTFCTVTLLSFVFFSFYTFGPIRLLFIASIHFLYILCPLNLLTFVFNLYSFTPSVPLLYCRLY